MDAATGGMSHPGRGNFIAMTTQLSVVTDGPLRVCRECRKPRPLGAYVLLDGECGYYGHEFAAVVCHTCRQRILVHLQDDRKETVADERRQAALKQIMQKLRGQGLTNAPHITELSHEVFGALGGVARVARDVKRTYEQVMMGMNTAQKMKMIQFLAKLSEASTEHRTSAPDLNDLDDRELKLVINQELLEMFHAELQLLQQAPDEPDESATPAVVAS